MMQDFSETMQQALPADFNIEPNWDKEYLGEDGELHCRVCHKPTTFRIIKHSVNGHIFQKLNIEDKRVRCICQCEVDRREAEEKRALQEKREAKVREIQSRSLIGDRYAGSSFTNFDMDVDKSIIEAKARAERYCDVYERCIKQNLGIYFYGANGLGKTEIMACMANKLIRDNFCTVLFTSFLDMAKILRKSFNKSGSKKEEELDALITTVDFCFIDDVGVEQFRKNEEDTWLQQKVYEIINMRYNAKKPTIFSSNYTFNELIEERGLLRATVERISEMSSAVIKMEGHSYRFRAKNQDMPF